MNNNTPTCERHYIQSEGYQNRNSHDLYSHQSHHDPNDSEKLLTELNNDMKQDLEDFKSCIRSMRTIHSKLFVKDDGKTTGDLPNKKKIDEWSKSQNVSSEQTDRTDPPPPQAHTKQVNVVFTESGKSDDPPKIQKDPPPLIIVINKIEKDQPFKTTKKDY
ncbi:hypothetical protein Tco_1523101 [Tanacetum coccineum]